MSIGKTFENISRRINKIVTGIDLKPYADEAVERIVRRTRTGGGLEKQERGARQKKLEKLSASYKDFRSGKVDFWTLPSGKIAAKKNSPRKKRKELSSDTKPAKSNLTFTGQLLNSLYAQVIRSKIIIRLREQRDDGKKNRDIVRWQAKQDRAFFELSKKEVSGLQSQIKKDLIKQLKRIK